MKKYLFVFALLASVLSFTACSDDDDDIDVAQLEGTWGLIQEEGYAIYNGKKETFNETYDPTNPTNEAEKLVISKVADKTYSVTSFYYYANKWNNDGTANFSLNGSKFAPVEGNTDTSMKLLSVTSEKLVFEISGTDEDGDFYGKMTYKRM